MPLNVKFYTLAPIMRTIVTVSITILRTKNEKDLGVIIDNELKYHVHAASATKKANQVLGIIKNSYYTRDTKTKPTLYKSKVRPLMRLNVRT